MANDLAKPKSELLQSFEDLTGQRAPFETDGACDCVSQLFAKGGMGWSQFNEVMILLGFDRVSAAFFQFLVDGTASYQPSAAIKSLDELRRAINRFRQLAMLRFGNIKFAFKIISALEEADLAGELARIAPIENDKYENRHEPARPIQAIAGDETYYLGYVVQGEIKSRLETNPNDANAKREWEKCEALIRQGVQNHEAYLASDHMDVYVATSMRERHEYYFVNKITQKIFEDEKLKALKPRWFDPTQAYCVNRIDKGLAEALMLKRAKCTLYFAQEIDTLGKDSELASTLAQGKPVIAFVPEIKDTYLRWLIAEAKKVYPDQDLNTLMRHQFELIAPRLAWSDSWVREWNSNPKSKTQAEVEKKLLEVIRKHYDGRAKLLKEVHPLGIQVNLATGVANGVLVARTTTECAELIYRVITNRLEFRIDSTTIPGYLLLRESTTDSVFRVVSGDMLLTNAFWNFYLV